MSNYNAKQTRKPLKGLNTISNDGYFNTLTANSIVLENVSIAGVFQDGIFQNVTMNNSNIINTPIGIGGPSQGYFTILNASQNVLFTGSTLNEYVSWDYLTATFSIGGTLEVDGCSYFDNIEICVNTISATNLDGDINLVSNRNGKIYVEGALDNTATTGNFSSKMLSGGFDVSAYTGISIGSSYSDISMSSYSDHNIYTLNGDINLVTELGAGTKIISSIDLISSGNASGLYRMSTQFDHNLKIGDTINVSGTGFNFFNGSYVIHDIVDHLRFTFTSGNIILTSGSSGIFNKVANNDINLLAGQYVNIPTNINLVLGTGSTTNNIVSDTFSNLVISSTNNIDLNTTNGSICIPQSTNLYFGPSRITSGSIGVTTSNLSFTSGGTVVFDGTYLNIKSDCIRNTGTLTSIDTINTKFYDPILSIANYRLNYNDNLDKGIEFYYTSSTQSSLGWFGYKNNANAFTFIMNATNDNEIITGGTGNFIINYLTTGNILLSDGGNVDINCGLMKNVNSISGCSDTLNIYGSSNSGAGTVNISTSNIQLNAYNKISIPNNIPLFFNGTLGNTGTNGSGSIFNSTIGDLVITGNNNIKLNASSVIIPINIPLSFDGTTSGNNIILCDTVGNTFIKTNNTCSTYLSTSNVIVPLSTNIVLGDSSRIIYGLSNSLNIVSSVMTNMSSLNNTTIYSSIGNVNVNAPAGDIALYTTFGSVKIPNNINFMFGSTANMIASSGNLSVIGATSGNVNYNVLRMNNINLSAGSNVNIPNNTYLNLGDSSYLVSGTSGTTYLTNTMLNGTLVMNGNNINITGSTLNVNANSVYNISTNSMSISTGYFVINGNNSSSTLIDTGNLNITDPNINIAYGNNSSVDKGILYNNNTTANGWFGVKNATNRFTYYSSATNANNIITGTIGDMEINNMYVDNSLSVNGNINLNCNTLLNVNTISSCGGDITITSNNIRLSANNSVVIPYSSLLMFGTAGNTITGDTYGNLNLNTSNASGTIVINGNLQVNGTTTNVYSTITNIQDPIVSIGGVIGPVVNDAKDRGIEFKWASGGGTKTGFFGFQNISNRFVFIPDGTNIYEVFYGSYGSVQFNNGYFNNLDLSSNGTNAGSNIYGVTNIYSNTTGNTLNLNSNAITLNGNTTVPINNYLYFGSTSSSLSAQNSSGNITLTSNTLSFSTGNSITIEGTTPLYYGNDKTVYSMRDSSGNYIVSNTSGSINLSSSTSINVLDNIPINFGSTADQIYSNNSELFLIGYNGISISSGTITLGGNVNITGNITGISSDIDLNRYILPLGTSQVLTINTINNNTAGEVQISTSAVNYLSVNDSVSIVNSNSIPAIDGNWTVTGIVNPNTFIINNNTSITSVGNNGKCTSILTVDQGKDVGIQVNYWSTSGNYNNITAGSINYKTGFFGYKLTTKNWTFYNDATISNNVVTKGDLGDITINKLNTNNISGFILDGPVTTGSNAVMGSNFIISGGSIDNTPIGGTIAQSGRFNILSNTVSASLENVTLLSNLIYSFERFTLNSLLQYRNPSTNTIVSFVSVNGVSFNASGTLGNIGISDGQLKTIACSSMGANCTYTIHVGSGNLIAPNISNNNLQPSKLQFTRSGQSVQMIFDGNLSAWLILGRGCSVF
jgi:hypothetical protein